MSSPRRVTAPASKSLSHRYCIGAALAAGESRLRHVLESRDTQCTRAILSAAGAAFFEGVTSADPAVLEAAQWIDAVRNDKQPCVLPEQAFTVTRILEGIYISAKTGDLYRF